VKPADVLCALDRLLLQEFSRRTVAALGRHTLFSLLLPPFRRFLDINVRKEIDKDCRAIRRAAAICASGAQPGVSDIDQLLGEARAVDQDFLRDAMIFPVTLRIPYSDIEPLRRQRIGRVLNAVCAILPPWRTTRSLRRVLPGIYSPAGFQGLLREVLQLYILETRALSGSVRLPQVMGFVRDQLVATVFSEMQQAADALAEEAAHSLYVTRS
jgi:hypothetical protein